MIEVLHRQRHRAQRVVCDVRRPRPRAIDQLPERGRADRVGDEMDASRRIRIEHVVLPPGVEDPRLACAHVHRLFAADEADVVIRHHRHVHARVLAPVVIRVGVHRRFGIAVDAHQARAAPHRVKRRQHLAQVRAAIEMRRRAHRSAHVVVHRIAVHRDQRQRAVAGMSFGVRTPRVFVELRDLGSESRGVESQGKLNEFRR
jgi:hypothetical protein